MTPRKFNSYTYGEASTGGGQLVEFSCAPEDKERVSELLSMIRFVSLPTHRKTHVSHGGFGRDTRYDVTQEKYAGGGSGYIEALQIKNPPDGRNGFIVHEWTSRTGSIFYEFETLAQCVEAWESAWPSGQADERLQKSLGFKRRVSCGGLDPWFYATGEQKLSGDFVYPLPISETPEFRFGKRYVTTDYRGCRVVRTCWGVREYERSESFSSGTKKYTSVQWDDGTTWDSYLSSCRPRMLRAEEEWIDEAIGRFEELLAGHRTDFQIEFRDGTRFEGRLRQKKASLAGVYQVTMEVRKKGKEKVERFEAFELHFDPAKNGTDSVEEHLRHFVDSQGGELVTIESIVRKRRVKITRDLEWVGVFPPPAP